MEVLLSHLNYGFDDFLGDHAEGAIETLRDRRENIKKEVQEKLAAARRHYGALLRMSKANFQLKPIRLSLHGYKRASCAGG
jgi:hypothetical protein